MKEYLPVISSSRLFSGITETEALSMLECLSARTAYYEKNEQILRFGDAVDTVGMVLSGSIHVSKEDFWGNRNILTVAGPGELFAETYACVPDALLSVSVTAAVPAEVLFLDVRRVLTTCSSSCVFHARLIRNLLSVMAAKNLAMNEKMTHMSRRTTREKLLSYLSAQSLRQGSPVFDIPYNRQQLADYLSVDRSAMSNELCKLRDEGVLRFERNHFTLLRQLDEV
ncbi:Crp/Fnr family transcriptional regulator [Candidatus Soleaferrea massiliensis]|uniref:Crp/Fnr family transcriptional regulator n=1 Tax=Candidatus Soleaferrea massiliensis TaxID=1470354 RepID=UPI00058E70CB|nr:Crp/Fnr family transcriptional regulator [Candidatus Soleaferrea massiliensis]